MGDEKYNGWENYETWSVNLLISNDEHDDKYARELVNNARSVSRGADALKDWIEDIYYENDPLKEFPLFQQLLTGALSSVNWYEIAKYFWDEEVHAEYLRCDECGTEGVYQDGLCEDCYLEKQADEVIAKLPKSEPAPEPESGIRHNVRMIEQAISQGSQYYQAIGLYRLDESGERFPIGELTISRERARLSIIKNGNVLNWTHFGVQRSIRRAILLAYKHGATIFSFER